MRKLINITLRSIAIIFLLVIIAIASLSVSPIYNFEETAPFSGEKIYNPYRNIDTTIGWMKGNFHTHTKVDKGINECPFYPDVVYDEYTSYGYDIIAFSNHQQLTTHPYNPDLQINVYEHGYNFFKFHKLVFGCDKERKFDHLLPFLDSQKQFMIDLLRKDGDFVVFNHPDRTSGIGNKTMKRITGYSLIEGDAGFEESDKGRGTKLRRWDEALSAGIYSHNFIGDDNHNPKKTSRIARRASFLNTPTKDYEQIKQTLLEGNFYTMRIPDYGDGDTAAKRDFNKRLPEIVSIGLKSDTIYIELSEPAEYIKVTTTNGKTADSVTNSEFLYFKMDENMPFARFTARYENGITIYSNAFARYGEESSEVNPTPFDYSEKHSINLALTILFNLLLLSIICCSCVLIFKLIKHYPRIH